MACCAFKSCLSGPPTQCFASCSSAMAWDSICSRYGLGPVYQALFRGCHTPLAARIEPKKAEEVSTEGASWSHVVGAGRRPWEPGQQGGSRPRDPAACGLGPRFNLPCRSPLQES